MKKVVCLLFVFVLLFSLSACAGSKAEEERIERVVTRVLTCPDEKLVALLKENNIYNGDNPQPDPELLLKRQQAEEAYAEHLKTVFTTEDMTEDFQQRFCGNGYAGLTYPSVCAMEGIQIRVESVSVALVSEENRRYSFTAELIITDKDGNETPHTQEGKVQLSEDGRVSWIDSKPLMALSDVVVRIVNDMYS